MLGDGVPAGGPPNAYRVVGEAPLEIGTKLSLSARLANVGPRRLKGPDRLVLNSPVILMKWKQPATGAPEPGPDTFQLIIDRWNPFNQRDTSVTYTRDLYHTSHRILVVVILEEYFVPFPSYLDKNSYHHVAEDGMHMRNHDFNETTELACSDFFSFEPKFLFRHVFLMLPLL